MKSAGRTESKVPATPTQWARAAIESEQMPQRAVRTAALRHDPGRSPPPPLSRMTLAPSPALLLRDVRPFGAAPVDVLVQGDRIAAGLAPVCRRRRTRWWRRAAARCCCPAWSKATRTRQDAVGLALVLQRGRHTPGRPDRQRARLPACERARDAATQSLALASRPGDRHDAHSHPRRHRLRKGLQHLRRCARDAMAPWQQIQTVAFPQSGLLVRPGTAELLMLRYAAGADVLGGLTPVPSTATRCACSTLASPRSMASRWTSTCTSPARWAPSRSA